nr:unnamed protein product [Callosobruchus analis]
MCMVEKDCIPLIQIDDHHPALCIKVMDILYRERSFDTNSHAKVYNFKKADFIRLYNALKTLISQLMSSIKEFMKYWIVMYHSTKTIGENFPNGMTQQSLEI